MAPETPGTRGLDAVPPPEGILIPPRNRNIVPSEADVKVTLWTARRHLKLNGDVPLDRGKGRLGKFLETNNTKC